MPKHTRMTLKDVDRQAAEERAKAKQFGAVQQWKSKKDYQTYKMKVESPEAFDIHTEEDFLDLIYELELGKFYDLEIEAWLQLIKRYRPDRLEYAEWVIKNTKRRSDVRSYISNPSLKINLAEKPKLLKAIFTGASLWDILTFETPERLSAISQDLLNQQPSQSRPDPRRDAAGIQKYLALQNRSPLKQKVQDRMKHLDQILNYSSAGIR